jgi:hypothetical protein
MTKIIHHVRGRRWSPIGVCARILIACVSGLLERSTRKDPGEAEGRRHPHWQAPKAVEERVKGREPTPSPAIAALVPATDSAKLPAGSAISASE